MVSMYSTLIQQPWCAGTLIAKDWVVTAAHCFNFVFSNPATWTLHFGKQNASGSAEYTYEQVRTISKLTIHPDYQPEAQNFSFNNDVALIKLDRPVVFNDYTAPLCLVQQADHVTDHVIEERECTITGYGIANKTHTLHEINVLHVAHVPLIDKQTCAGLQGYADKITDNMICAGFDTGAVDTCKGDSGGPLQCKVGEKWYLVGVTSWGGKNYEGCAEPSEPGAYTDVSRYTDWIYTQIFNDYRTNTNTGSN